MPGISAASPTEHLTICHSLQQLPRGDLPGVEETHQTFTGNFHGIPFHPEYIHLQHVNRIWLYPFN